MKKFLLFILSIVYLTASTGATIHMHYCMDKLVSVNFQDDGSECISCGMSNQKDNGCCKDEHKQIKVDKEQTPSTYDYEASNAFAQEYVSGYSLVPQFIYSSRAISYPISHAPPGSGKVAVFIRNCTFLI